MFQMRKNAHFHLEPHCRYTTCCFALRCPMWITGTRGVHMENVVAAVAEAWPWEPEAVSLTGNCNALICMQHQQHRRKHVWIKRFMGTDCIVIVKECLEVMGLSYVKQTAGRGPSALTGRLCAGCCPLAIVWMYPDYFLIEKLKKRFQKDQMCFSLQHCLLWLKRAARKSCSALVPAYTAITLFIPVIGIRPTGYLM